MTDCTNFTLVNLLFTTCSDKDIFEFYFILLICKISFCTLWYLIVFSVIAYSMPILCITFDTQAYCNCRRYICEHVCSGTEHDYVSMTAT